MLGNIEGRRRSGVGTEDEIVEWYHQLNGHEFAQTPGEGEGQGPTLVFLPGKSHGQRRLAGYRP